MDMLYFCESRLKQTADGNFFSADQSFSYHMFKRYLQVYDRVLVVARSSKATIHDKISSFTQVNANSVSVLPLPCYVGFCQFFLKRKILKKILCEYIDHNSSSVVICRVPGIIGTTAIQYCSKLKRPYGLEVVGDPLDVFAPGSFSHPLRIFFRYKFVKDLKFFVQHAAATLYVSKETLQSRYPATENTFSTYASNVMLPPEAFVPEAKTLNSFPPFSLVTVGSLAAMYKSPDIAIEALAILKQRGLSVSLQWLGDGRYRPEMVALAAKVGVSDVVSFVGNIGSAVKVRAYLDGADLFVLPSRTEGLPRALVEAMARGLPCIGTNIGGIPELLEQEALVPVNDPERLAHKIEHFLTTPELANAQAKRNLLEARNYAFDILEARRNQFYEYLKGIS